MFVVLAYSYLYLAPFHEPRFHAAVIPYPPLKIAFHYEFREV